MGDPAANKDVVARMWADLARRDWDALPAYFGSESHYTDVGAGEEGATGPDRIVARLRLGLERLEGYQPNPPRLVVAEGDAVIVEHTEEWRWHTGESVVLPFVSVHEVHDGVITRWHDYWDLQTLMNAAPAWWVEHIMQGY